MRPLVSVIVPMYNVAEFIERCVISLFEQTFDSLEYIFVDDGSTDNTLEVLNTVLNRNPERKRCTKVIELGTNGGVAAARQNGLEHADGDFLAFVDADDFVPTNFIQSLYNSITNNCLDIVVCDHVYVFSDRKVRKPTVFADDKDDFCASLMTGSLHAGFCNKLVKKQLFTDNDLCFSSHLRVLEDKAMMVKLFHYASAIGHCPETVYNYNKTNVNSLTSQAKVSQTDSLVLAWYEIADFYRGKEYSQKMADAIDFFRIGILASVLYFFDKYKWYDLRQDLTQRPHLTTVLKQPVIPLNNKIILIFYSLHLDWFVTFLRYIRRWACL